MSSREAKVDIHGGSWTKVERNIWKVDGEALNLECGRKPEKTMVGSM